MENLYFGRRKKCFVLLAQVALMVVAQSKKIQFEQGVCTGVGNPTPGCLGGNGLSKSISNWL